MVNVQSEWEARMEGGESGGCQRQGSGPSIESRRRISVRNSRPLYFNAEWKIGWFCGRKKKRSKLYNSDIHRYSFGLKTIGESYDCLAGLWPWSSWILTPILRHQGWTGNKAQAEVPPPPIAKVKTANLWILSNAKILKHELKRIVNGRYEFAKVNSRVPIVSWLIV